MISHAAIITECGVTITGKCHADCFREGTLRGLKLLSAVDNQGFLCNKGIFHRRHEAAHVAFICGQIDKKVKILFSEELWCERDGGKYDYNPITGYYLREAQSSAENKER